MNDKTTRRGFLAGAAGASALGFMPGVVEATPANPRQGGCTLLLERFESWRVVLDGEGFLMPVHAVHVLVDLPLPHILLPCRGNNRKFLFPSFEINDYEVVVEGYPTWKTNMERKSTGEILRVTFQEQVRSLNFAEADYRDYQGFYVHAVTPDGAQHHLGLVRRDAHYDSEDIIWSFQANTKDIFKT